MAVEIAGLGARSSARGCAGAALGHLVGGNGLSSRQGGLWEERRVEAGPKPKRPLFRDLASEPFRLAEPSSPQRASLHQRRQRRPRERDSTRLSESACGAETVLQRKWTGERERGVSLCVSLCVPARYCSWVVSTLQLLAVDGNQSQSFRMSFERVGAPAFPFTPERSHSLSVLCKIHERRIAVWRTGH